MKKSKPIELAMNELREKIISECAASKMNLYFIDFVLEKVYKDIHTEYINDLNNRIKEYNDLSNESNQKKEGE